MRGKEWRLSRIFGPDHRTVILPIDHGLALGNVPGLEDPRALLGKFLSGPLDGVLLSSGIDRVVGEGLSGRNSPSRLMTVDTFFDREDGTVAYEVLATPEDAVRQGFDAIKVIMLWDQPSDIRLHMAHEISRIIQRADAWEIPVVVEPTTRRTAATDAMLSDAVRIAIELGADILKVPIPRDYQLLGDWVGRYDRPTLVLGGGVIPSVDDTLTQARLAMDMGVSGLVMGRAVWQRPHDEGPRLLRDLWALVHGSGHGERGQQEG